MKESDITIIDEAKDIDPEAFYRDNVLTFVLTGTDFSQVNTEHVSRIKQACMDICNISNTFPRLDFDIETYDGGKTYKIHVLDKEDSLFGPLIVTETETDFAGFESIVKHKRPVQYTFTVLI